MSGGGSDSNMTTFDAQEDAAAPAATDSSARTSPRPPGVAPTAAPGVAFNYRYAFRLPAANIGRVQEEHAQACERLTVARCRITAMTYEDDGDGDVEAQLSFKLDPAIARTFGRDGIAAVDKAQGELLRAAITGTDVGSEISAAQRGQAQQADEVRRIEQQLARPGIRSDERVRLEFEAQQLRQQIPAPRDSQAEGRESLATTPMVFEYGAGESAPGFDDGPSIPRALDSARDNFVGGIAMLIVLIVTLLPWAAFALLAWLLFRLARPWVRRILPVRPPTAAPGEDRQP